MALRLLSTQVDPPQAIEAALAPISPLAAAQIEASARRIVDAVRQRGDAAVREFVREFDRLDLDQLEVPRDDIASAGAQIAPEVLAAMEVSAERIAAFYRQQPRGDWVIEQDGVRLGYLERPLDRVGIIVPTLQAPLASTLLMAAVSARAAGVREVIVCSATRRDGSVDPHLLAAARVAGVDRYFRIGGAQAIAAMAFGTESVPRVDKIFGAGNPFVVMAMRLVFGQVDIHSLPGPSEIVVIADDSAPARWAAADLLSQAEHGEDSLALLLTPSLPLARAVMDETNRQLNELPRASVARACLERRGWAIVTRDLEEACALANRCAPEHVELLVQDPRAWLPHIRNTGAVFLGHYSSEPVGDYIAGPSHILPTGGTARFASPMHVSDFLKRVSIIEYTASPFQRDAPHVQALARAEGLEAHARAIQVRLEH